MINVFDMSSGELLYQEHCEERAVDRRHGILRTGLAGSFEAGARTYRDGLERLPCAELALLPVEATERR